MRAAALSLLLPIALTLSAAAQTRINSINTSFRWLGPDDKIVVERYDNPKVANVSCYMFAPKRAASRVVSDLPKTRAASRSPAARSVPSPCRSDWRSPR